MAYKYSAEKNGDSFVITVSSPKNGDATFTFDDVIAVKGSVEATVTAETTVGDKTGASEVLKYVQRLSAYSSQSRGDYARQLDICFGGGHKWPLILSGVVSSFVDAWKSDSFSSIVAASDIEEEEARFLFEPWLEEKSANLLYAKGGTGKTYFSLRLALSVVSGLPLFSSKPSDAGSVLFIDYENNGSTFRKRLRKLCAGMGLDDSALADCHYYDPKGVPLHMIRDDVARFVREKGVKLVIVDSAAPACGGPPEDAAVASQYFAALRVISCTSLTVAHEAKAGGGTTAFGSVFWTNFSRNIFYLEAVVGFSGSVVKLLLKHQKFNNGPRRDDFPMMFKAHESSVSYEADSAAPKKKTNAERIVTCLRENGGEMSIMQISKREAISYGVVVNSLLTLKDAGSVLRGSKDGNWRLADASDL